MSDERKLLSFDFDLDISGQFISFFVFQVVRLNGDVFVWKLNLCDRWLFMMISTKKKHTNKNREKKERVEGYAVRSPMWLMKSLMSPNAQSLSTAGAFLFRFVVFETVFNLNKLPFTVCNWVWFSAQSNLVSYSFFWYGEFEKTTTTATTTIQIDWNHFKWTKRTRLLLYCISNLKSKFLSSF